MTNFWVRMGSAALFAGVAIGAFGAHGLKNILTDPMKMVFDTGIKYHLIHGLALFIVAWLTTRSTSGYITAAGWCFTWGIVLFSGSLYLLALTGIKTLGAITPLGGLSFLVGWLLVFFSAAR